MIRTTIYLPKTVHKKAKETAKRGEKSFSQYATESLEKNMKNEAYHHADVYEATEKMIGIVKENVTDASTTIDELLYGENGVWRGSNRNTK